MTTKRSFKPSLSDNTLEARLDLAAVGMVAPRMVHAAVAVHPVSPVAPFSPIGNLPVGGLRGPLRNAFGAAPLVAVHPVSPVAPFSPIGNLPVGGLRGPLRNAFGNPFNAFAFGNGFSSTNGLNASNAFGFTTMANPGISFFGFGGTGFRGTGANSGPGFGPGNSFFF